MNLEKKLKSRLRKSFNVNFFSFLINLTTQILTVPIMLTNWGVNLYGEWILLSAVTQYILFSNFGITDAFSNEMTILCAKGKFIEALKIFQNSWILVSLSSVIISSAIFFFIYFCSPKSTLNIKLLSHFEINLIIGLLIIYILLSIQLSLVTSAYKAVREYSFSVFILNSIRSSEFICGIIIIYLGHGPSLFIFSNVIIRLIGLFYTITYLQTKHNWISFNIKNINIPILRNIFKPSIASGGFAFGNLLINQGMILLIGSNSGSSSVVIFNTIRTYSRMLLKVSSIAINSYSPEMSYFYGMKKIGLLRFLNRKLIRTTFLISLFTFFLSYLCGEYIIKLWTADKVTFSHDLYLLILFETLIYSVWYVVSVPITSVNKHLSIVIWYIVCGLLSLILAFSLFPRIGLIAAPISLIISDFFIGFYVIRKMLRLTQDNILTISKNIFFSKGLKF